ncbi:MAG TPA: double-strand break repair protein AddB [Rhizomicrobium sp.]
MPGRVFTIPSSAPFADTLARGLIAQLGDAPLALADATIYLPTRRAQRTFGDAFARVLGGAALLPSFKALGDAEDDEFFIETEALDLSPAIAPMRRRLLLAAMVQHWHRAKGGEDIGFAQAAALADGLAQVMDEVETQGVKLADIEKAVPSTLARHWEQVSEFLSLLDTQWPALLAAEGKIAPADRRNRALRALAMRMAQAPPKGPVIAAGSTGSIPATAKLLEVIANLPNGSVVLPGLDRDLDEASWRDLNPGHPQFGMKQLLSQMKVDRVDVKDWAPPRNVRRERALGEALRPAPTTDAWRAIAQNNEESEIGEGLRGLSLIEAADPMTEASVIALVLREALEEPGKTATLVTPDRTLARRVAGELRRWEVEVDDSAGRPLAHTPPGAFLCLLAEATDAGFAPVPLLALLKHPLCTLGREPGDFRTLVRRLDLLLRGPRPNPGLDGIREAITKRRAEASALSQARLSELQYWWSEAAKALRPLEAALAKRTAALDKIVVEHFAAAERLAGNALRRGDAGNITDAFMVDLNAAARDLPAVEPGAYAALFRKLALKPDVRSPRAGHPRVAIMGPLEARLQSFDTVVLGGLNEGTWPRSPGADPWFSRPMRKALGLEQPERAIGQAAHDFATLAAGPRVVLTRAQKSEGVPTIPSRWVQRLTQLAGGLGLTGALTPDEDYVALAESLSDAGEPVRIRMPRPSPPVAARPKRLPVTDIEKWVRDPYAIYARRILGLRILKPLEAEIGPMERGDLVHRALQRFVNELPGELPPDAAVRLCAIADEVFAAEGTPKAALALWQPRFTRAAEWFVAIEALRRDDIKTSHTEIAGAFKVTPDFELYGVADRIDVLSDSGAAILDYKTGQVPTKKQIESFLAPQLLLEAAMLGAGAFEGLGKLETRDLLYVQISGGRVPGTMLEVDIALIGETLEKLKKRITDFARADTGYPPRLHPKEARVSGDYDHLARVREWSIGGWEAPEK